VNTLIDIIKDYYTLRDLKWPDIWEALAFVQTEMGEVYEILLAERGGWVRNNPGDKPTFTKESLSEEIGDAIMMLLVAGISRGVDPIESLKNKLARKILDKQKSPLYKNKEQTANITAAELTVVLTPTEVDSPDVIEPIEPFINIFDRK